MNKNTIFQDYTISKKDRNSQNQHASFVVWFTGLSGSGKSAIANELEKSLFKKKIKTFVLDGDNTRLGINKDLDFSDADRKENIRRVAEISKLLIDAGVVVITSFISPFDIDRLNSKVIIGSSNFIEIFVDCPVEICEDRDVKGLYKKARNGEIKNFTGIDSNFEKPKNPDIHLKTNELTVEECVELIVEKIEKRLQNEI